MHELAETMLEDVASSPDRLLDETAHMLSLQKIAPLPTSLRLDRRGG